MVIIGLLVSDGTHLEDALSGSLILEDLSEEKTQSRIYDNKIVDGVRKEGFIESASVRDDLKVIDLRDGATSVNLRNLS